MCYVSEKYELLALTVPRLIVRYSVEVGNIHVSIISTEHNFLPGSPQLAWLQADLASVDRTVSGDIASF